MTEKTLSIGGKEVKMACFPPAEAATAEQFEDRLEYYGNHFWLMFDVDKLIAFVTIACSAIFTISDHEQYSTVMPSMEVKFLAVDESYQHLPYNAMKKLMGDQLHYVHCGDEIRIRTTIERIVWNTVHSTDSGKQEEAPKYRIKDSDASKTSQKRREYMKWHKFFAWGTVVCFVMTMVTGYKRK